MLPKNIRDLRREAKQSLKGMKRVLDLMEKMLQSENADKVCVASAFFQILKHHMEEGDLSAENLSLATMLRGDGTGLTK